MSSVRLQVVSGLVAALSTATSLTTYRNLDYALEDKNLPALVVRSGDDQVTDSDLNATGDMDQQLMLVVSILIAESADPEAAADAFECLVHASLAGTNAVAGHAVQISRVSGDWDFDLGDCCERRVIYRVGYSNSIASLES